MASGIRAHDIEVLLLQIISIYFKTGEYHSWGCIYALSSVYGFGNAKLFSGSDPIIVTFLLLLSYACGCVFIFESTLTYGTLCDSTGDAVSFYTKTL